MLTKFRVEIVNNVYRLLLPIGSFICARVITNDRTCDTHLQSASYAAPLPATIIPCFPPLIRIIAYCVSFCI